MPPLVEVGLMDPKCLMALVVLMVLNSLMVLVVKVVPEAQADPVADLVAC